MQKRGLGRGLAALIPEAGDAPSEQVREVLVEHVTPNPFQPRTLFDPVKMEEMIASVREHGVLQPVLVRPIGPDRYQLIAGERRFRAAKTAGLTRVPAVVRECSDRDALEVAVVENLQREDIGAVEAARAYERLIAEFGLTQEEVARRVGKSRSAVANTLRLLALPEPILASIELGKITEGHARALLMADGPAAQERVWKAVLQRELNVRDTERLARGDRDRPVTDRAAASEGGGTAAAVGRDAADPNLLAVVDRLQERLGTKVALRHTTGGGGRIEIEFYSPSELERLAEALLGGPL